MRLNQVRDRATGRVFFTDASGHEVDRDGNPIAAKAPAAPESQDLWLNKEEAQFVASHPHIAEMIARTEPRMHSAIVAAAREGIAKVQADAAAEVKAQVEAASGKSIVQLRELSAKGNEVAAAILAVREYALEDAAFQREWSAEGLRMATASGFSEQRLREDFHKRFVASSGDTRSY